MFHLIENKKPILLRCCPSSWSIHPQTPAAIESGIGSA